MEEDERFRPCNGALTIRWQTGHAVQILRVVVVPDLAGSFGIGSVLECANFNVRAVEEFGHDMGDS